MPYWRHKSILITGGSAGLGRVLAEAFCEHGARVVIAARNEDRLKRAVATLKAKGGDVAGVAADATKQEDVERLLAKTVEQLDKLDVLINCAGRSARSPILDTRAEAVAELLDVNFLSAVRCSQAAAPHLIETGGHLVNIGSLASKIATPYYGGYPASKFALAGYTQQLRLALRPKGVHVLLACPGPIARIDGEERIIETTVDVPASALEPGGGAKIGAIDPHRLANRILTACERRRAELIVPTRARLLVVLAAMSPRLGDWLLGKFS